MRVRFYVEVTGVSGIVVVLGCAGGVTGSYGAAVPSTPLEGCGAACPPLFWPGLAVALWGGFDTAGG